MILILFNVERVFCTLYGMIQEESHGSIFLIQNRWYNRRRRRNKKTLLCQYRIRCMVSMHPSQYIEDVKYLQESIFILFFLYMYIENAIKHCIQYSVTYKSNFIRFFFYYCVLFSLSLSLSRIKKISQCIWFAFNMHWYQTYTQYPPNIEYREEEKSKFRDRCVPRTNCFVDWMVDSIKYWFQYMTIYYCYFIMQCSIQHPAPNTIMDHINCVAFGAISLYLIFVSACCIRFGWKFIGISFILLFHSSFSSLHSCLVQFFGCSFGVFSICIVFGVSIVFKIVLEHIITINI